MTGRSLPSLLSGRCFGGFTDKRPWSLYSFSGSKRFSSEKSKYLLLCISLKSQQLFLTLQSWGTLILKLLSKEQTIPS